MIEPCGHRVLVRRDRVEDHDPAFKKMQEIGLVIPHTEDREREQAGLDRGEIVAVGPDAWKAFYLASNPADQNLRGFTPWAKVGDFVVFAKYAGKVIKDKDGKEYMAINDEDIVVVLKD